MALQGEALKKYNAQFQRSSASPGGDQPAAPKVVTDPAEYPLGDGAIDANELGKVIANRLPEHAIVCDEGATNGLGAFLLTANAPPHDWLTLTGGAIGQGGAGDGSTNGQW